MPRSARRDPDEARRPPEVSLTGGTVATSEVLLDGSADLLAVPLAPARPGDDGPAPREGTAQAAARYGIDLGEMAERQRLTGAAGEVSVLQLPRPVGSVVELPWTGLPPRLALVGVGNGTPAELRKAGAALARASRGLRSVVTTVGADRTYTASQQAAAARAVVEGYLLAAYVPPTSAATPPAQPAADLVLLGRDGTRATAAVASARAAASATWLVRDLTTTPASTKTPEWLAGRATALAQRAGLRSRVLGPRELAAGGFGGLLAVGGASASTPRLVTVTWEPPTAEDSRHVVLVGKGITFDTGGLSIKPREPMVAMKTDMAGAAVVLATVLAAAATGVRHRVTAVLPLAENHVGAASYRPGDVVTVHGGTTVEVTNTDAEGRLVLADALAWADATLDPDVLVDVATLTGAAAVALGRRHAALYGDPELVAGLQESAQRTGELVWPMPLVADYEEALRSEVADVRQVANDPDVKAGSIVAALFLRRFVGSRPWAHLDIAGTARATKDADEVTEGATGYGARLLLDFLAELR